MLNWSTVKLRQSFRPQSSFHNLLPKSHICKLIVGSPYISCISFTVFSLITSMGMLGSKNASIMVAKYCLFFGLIRDLSTAILPFPNRRLTVSHPEKAQTSRIHCYSTTDIKSQTVCFSAPLNRSCLN